MSSPGSCNEPSVRADYQALFNAAQGVTECFNQQQKNQFVIWMLHAVVANDLFTDDSFVFLKAVGMIKDAISGLPIATVDDENDEAAALKENLVPHVIKQMITCKVRHPTLSKMIAHMLQPPTEEKNPLIHLVWMIYLNTSQRSPKGLERRWLLFLISKQMRIKEISEVTARSPLEMPGNSCWAL
ncbi:hypothetical protein ABZP36_022427 [Zizania latifolia]